MTTPTSPEPEKTSETPSRPSASRSSASPTRPKSTAPTARELEIFHAASRFAPEFWGREAFSTLQQIGVAYPTEIYKNKPKLVQHLRSLVFNGDVTPTPFGLATLNRYFRDGWTFSTDKFVVMLVRQTAAYAYTNGLLNPEDFKTP